MMKLRLLSDENNQQPQADELVVPTQQEEKPVEPHVYSSDDEKPVEITGDNNEHHDEL